jgi:hypothetical protein
LVASAPPAIGVRISQCRAGTNGENRLPVADSRPLTPKRPG